MESVFDLGEERTAQILSRGYKHTYFFSHRFLTIPAGTVAVPTRTAPFLFQIGQESWFVWTKLGVWANPANGVGQGFSLESLRLEFTTVSSGRLHQSEPFEPITLMGTIGYPYNLPAKQFFPRATNLQVVVENLSTGTNTVVVNCHGYRFYPDPADEKEMMEAFVSQVGQ